MNGILVRTRRNCFGIPFGGNVTCSGTDAALIAECLGLDPTSYKKAQAKEEGSSTATFAITDQV